VPAVLTPPDDASVDYRHATAPAQLSQKRPALADKAIGAVLKDIQAWDNIVCTSRQGNVGSQLADL